MTNELERERQYIALVERQRAEKTARREAEPKPDPRTIRCGGGGPDVRK